MKKPIRIFFSPLTNTFFATQYYKQEGDKVTITGHKDDVTQDVAAIFSQYIITFSKAEPE